MAAINKCLVSGALTRPHVDGARLGRDIPTASAKTGNENFSSNQIDTNNNDSLNNNIKSKSYTHSMKNINNNVYSEENVDERYSATSACEAEAKLINIQKMPKSHYVEYQAHPTEGLSPQLAFLCTAIYSMMTPGALIGTFVLIGAFFTRFYYLALIYVFYLYLDRNTCNKGGRRFDIVYRSRFWSYVAAYFPIKLRFTSNFRLDPQENYILSYSPHGISAFGAVTAFATDGMGLSHLFPAIKMRFLVHERLFSVPVMKETCASRGDCSVNSNSIDTLLSDSRSRGNLLTLVVGGLAEADLSHEEILKIVVAERKGFVKKALMHGAHIIPCIAFGENSVFKKINLNKNSLLSRLESKWYQLFKFKHPIYYGRSYFSENRAGVMPYKRPITVVLGDPIHVTKKDKPSQQDIDATHAIYLDCLRSIYESNKDLTQKYDRVLQLV